MGADRKPKQKKEVRCGECDLLDLLDPSRDSGTICEACADSCADEYYPSWRTDGIDTRYE